MLKHTPQFQREQKRQEEIIKIVQEVSDVERKYALKFVIKKLSEKRILTKEESEILDEMLAKIQKKREEIIKIVQEVSDIERKYALKFAIKKLYKKKKLTKEESKILDALLAKSEAEQNDLKPESEPSAPLVPTEMNQAKKQEIQVKPQFFDQLKEIVAKRRVLIDEETRNTEHTQKNKKKSEDQKTELTEKSEEEKSSNPTAVEGQFMQKNVDIDLKQNSDEDSFLLQQIKAARKQLTNNQTTLQEDNLPSWIKSELKDSASKKKLLEEKKEQALFDFSESVCARTDLSEEERQEIINFHEQVYDVKLRFRDEACKKRFEGTVSKIFEEITRPNSTINELDKLLESIKQEIDLLDEETVEETKLQTPVSLQFKPNNTLHNKHEGVTVEMIPKPNFK